MSKIVGGSCSTCDRLLGGVEKVRVVGAFMITLAKEEEKEVLVGNEEEP
jgi:hypothetical protein